ncbi:MAG: hypothetical protein WAW57_15500 [Lutibacter sp.]
MPRENSVQEKTKVFIDSCAVNVLFDNSIDISAEFPEELYELIITLGVKQELLDIPDEKPVKKYAMALIENINIEEASFFGFSDLDNPENDSRYIGGFGSGSFASDEQIEFLDETEIKLGPKRKSGLAKNETDRDLLALSLKSVTLTAESNIGGMSQTAEGRDSKIINIKNWAPTKMALRAYVESEIMANSG